MKVVVRSMRPSIASLKPWPLVATPLAKCMVYFFRDGLGEGVGEPSSPWGIVLYGAYSAVLRGSVPDDACHGWLFDQQGTRRKSATCLVTVICHKTTSKG